MAKIKVGDHPWLVAKRTDTAPGRAVMALQRSTGKKLAELRDESEFSESLGMYVVAFLSLQTAGIFESWDDLLERPMGDIDYEEDEQEKRQREEAAAEEALAADPQEARTDSQPGELKPEPNDAAAPRSSSKRKSPGSKNRSTNASST